MNKTFLANVWGALLVIVLLGALDVTNILSSLFQYLPDWTLMDFIKGDAIFAVPLRNLLLMLVIFLVFLNVIKEIWFRCTVGYLIHSFVIVPKIPAEYYNFSILSAFILGIIVFIMWTRAR